MASSNTEPAGDGSGGETRAGPVVLSRDVEHREHGSIVTFELENRAGEAARVRLEQALPPERLVEDAGFRPDAGPEEWTVEDALVRGEARVPATEGRSLVFGLRYESDADAPDSLRPPTLERVTGDERPEGSGSAATAGDDTPAEGDSRVTAAVREVLGTLGGEAEAAAAGDDTDGPAADDREDEPAAEPLVTATDGGQTAAEGGGRDAGDGDGDETTPAPRSGPAGGPESLEAAVESVEADLDRPDDEPGPAPDEDLLPPGADGAEEETATGTLPTRDPDADGGAGDASDVAAALERLPDTEADADGTTGPSESGSAPTAGSGSASGGSALGGESATGDPVGERTASGGESTGPAEVRLSRLESRLSKLEAYEDALAAFIEESGTAEEVQATAREATAAVEELREEVRTARAEREQLREDVDALRANLADVTDLRGSLLDALQEPASAAGDGAAD